MNNLVSRLLGHRSSSSSNSFPEHTSYMQSYPVQQHPPHPNGNFNSQMGQQNFSHYGGNGLGVQSGPAFPQQQIRPPPPSHGNQQTFIFDKPVKLYGKDSTTVRHIHARPTLPPLFTLSTSLQTKPNVILFRGDTQPHNVMGTVVLHFVSSKSEIQYQGDTMKMKTSSLSGNHTIDSPRSGRLKWFVSPWGGSSLELKDDAGLVLARYGSDKFMGTKQLQIFAPCDDYFLGLVVMSAMACIIMGKVERKVASEVAGA